MKTCPVCGTSYDARVDFCFRDGEVLVDGPASAGSPAQAPEDEFDRPLPSADLPVAPPPNTQVPSAADLPQPRFVSSAADLPEPAFLNRETVEETAPFPTPAPSAPPRAPIPDDETLPMPLDGAGIASPVADEPAPVLPPPPPPPVAEPAPAPPAPAPEPEPEPFIPPVDSGFSPSPAPLPPIQPEPELDDWAGQEPEKEEERGGAPWALIGVAALLLLGIGGFFVWKSGQGATPEPGPVVADLDPATQVEPEPRTPNPKPVKPKAQPDPEPVPEPEVDANPSGPAPQPDARPPSEPTAPAVTSVEPTRTDPAAQPWDAPDPADTPQTGTLKLKTTPAGATLFVDGARVGAGPLDFTTTQGRHKVRAEAQGYKPQEIMISLNGESAAANLILQRDVQTQQVMLYGPADAKSVKVAGQTINALPATISLPVGRHVFTVTQADGTSFQVSQSIAQGGQANVMLLPPE